MSADVIEQARRRVMDRGKLLHSQRRRSRAARSAAARAGRRQWDAWPARLSGARGLVGPGRGISRRVGSPGIEEMQPEPGRDSAGPGAPSSGATADQRRACGLAVHGRVPPAGGWPAGRYGGEDESRGRAAGTRCIRARDRAAPGGKSGAGGRQAHLVAGRTARTGGRSRMGRRLTGNRRHVPAR